MFNYRKIFKSEVDSNKDDVESVFHMYAHHSGNAKTSSSSSSSSSSAAKKHEPFIETLKLTSTFKHLGVKSSEDLRKLE